MSRISRTACLAAISAVLMASVGCSSGTPEASAVSSDAQAPSQDKPAEAAMPQSQGPDNISATDRKLIEFGAGMHALGAACGHYDDANLDASKQQQKQMMLAKGISEADFERAFEQGHAAGMQKVNVLSPAERAASCQQLAEQAKALKAVAGSMAQ